LATGLALPGAGLTVLAAGAALGAEAVGFRPALAAAVAVGDWACEALVSCAFERSGVWLAPPAAGAGLGLTPLGLGGGFRADEGRGAARPEPTSGGRGESEVALGREGRESTPLGRGAGLAALADGFEGGAVSASSAPCSVMRMTRAHLRHFILTA